MNTSVRLDKILDQSHVVASLGVVGVVEEPEPAPPGELLVIGQLVLAATGLQQ
jgi:hypothetical protein